MSRRPPQNLDLSSAERQGATLTPSAASERGCKALQGGLQRGRGEGDVAGVFTAARIAAALGGDRANIRRELAKIAPDAVVNVRGNEAAAWMVASLPERLRLALRDEAAKRGYASEEHLLTAPPSYWQPDCPLSALDPLIVAKARRLQRAILPTLLRMSDPREQRADYLSAAAADYAREFGARPSERHLEALLSRTQQRDRGAEDWTRLELYLPDGVRARKECAAGESEASAPCWEPMLREAAHLAAQGSFDHAARCLFWDSAFSCLDAAIAGGLSPSRARNQLRILIEQKVPLLAVAGDTLSKQIRRLHKKWQTGGGSVRAVVDRRKLGGVGRPRRAALPAEFREKLLARAIHTAGGLAQAWRDARREGWMPEEIAAAYPAGSRKSDLPKHVRRDLGPELLRLAALVIGPRQADLAGPYVERTYENMPSGVQFQSDDCTLNVYFWVPDENGHPRLNEKGKPLLTRGQFLPWIDTRTSYIVTFQLIPEKNYDSIEIMRGIARLHDEYGLPESLYFEKGIWGSRLIDGSQHRRVPWKDFRYGLGHIGIRVIHANSPRAKIVERVLGALQDRMNHLRGYCGHDERRDCPEATKRAMQAVAAGRAHPGEFFLSMPEYVAELEKICDAYNEEPQEGKLLAGMSPAAAFVALRRSPPVQLPDEFRYLLARSRVETTVKTNGVEIRVGKRKFTYKDERTSAKIGERVLAWFNPEDPESICITDLNQRNPFTVRRCTLVDAYEADPEQLAQAMRENAAQTKHARTVFGRLRKNFPEEFQRSRRRLFMPPPQLAELGAEIGAQRGEANAEANADQKLRARGTKAAGKIGIRTRGDSLDAGRVAALSSLEKAGIKVINPYEE